MTRIVDHWYPTATIKDTWNGWVYEVENKPNKRQYFEKKYLAEKYARQQLQDNYVSCVTVYTSAGSVSWQQYSRLYKAIQEYKNAEVQKVKDENRDAWYHNYRIENITLPFLQKKSEALEEKVDTLEKISNGLKWKADKWDELQKLLYNKG